MSNIKLPGAGLADSLGGELPAGIRDESVTTSMTDGGYPIDDSVFIGLKADAAESSMLMSHDDAVEFYLKYAKLQTIGARVPITILVPADRKAEWEGFFKHCLEMFDARRQPK